MQYNETTALEIIAKFNLAPNTIKVWKNRGAIPNRYIDSEPKDLGEYVQDCDWLRDTLNHPVINKSRFDVFLGYQYATSSFCVGSVGIKQVQYQNILSELSKLKKVLCEYLEAHKNYEVKNALKKLVSIDFIKPYILFSTHFDKASITKMIYKTSSRCVVSHLTAIELPLSQKAVKQFRNELNLLDYV